MIFRYKNRNSAARIVLENADAECENDLCTRVLISWRL